MQVALDHVSQKVGAERVWRCPAMPVFGSMGKA